MESCLTISTLPILKISVLDSAALVVTPLPPTMIPAAALSLKDPLGRRGSTTAGCVT